MCYVSTFQQFVRAWDLGDSCPQSIACLAELCRSVQMGDVTEVEIYRLKMSGRGDYDTHGRYYGRGMPLFDLLVTTSEGYSENYTVRASDRATLRDNLKRLCRQAKISR